MNRTVRTQLHARLTGLCAGLLVVATVAFAPVAHAEDAPATPAKAAKPAKAAPEAPAKDTDLAQEGKDQAKSDKAAADEGTGQSLQSRIRAVSRKVFIKEGRFELDPFGGLSTNDAFFRRWMAGARASWHLSDAFSIDAGGAGTLFNETLDAVRIVGAEPGKPLVDTNQLYGYADLGVTFSPVYGKIALMSEGVIHFDGFVSGGIGATFDATPGLVHPALEVGAGTRVFLTHWLSVRAELRDYIYPQQLAGKTIFPNLLLLNIGLGIFFPLDFDYKYEAAKVNG